MGAVHRQEGHSDRGTGVNAQGEPMRDLRAVKADTVALVDVRRRAHRAGFHFQKARSDCPLCYIDQETIHGTTRPGANADQAEDAARRDAAEPSQPSRAEAAS